MYIKGNRSFVNLDVAEHVELVGSRGGHALKYTTDRNRELGITEEIDLAHLTSPVIPAGPVVTVICITPAGEVTAAPIAGWRVLRTGLEPLFVVEPPADGVRFLVVGGQGLVRLDTGVIFSDLASARAAVLGMVQEDHPAEIEHAPKAAAGARRGAR